MRWIWGWIGALLWAQQVTVYRGQGLSIGRPTKVALVGVRVWLGPARSIGPATVLLAEGRIVALGETSRVQIPKGYHIRRYPGPVWVYPAFVEPWHAFKDKEEKRQSSGRPQYEPTRQGLYYPNDAVLIDFSADTAIEYDLAKAESLRKMGFAVIHVAPRQGILRGTGATLFLADEGREAEKLLRSRPILHGGFVKGSLRQEYPSSLMGAIALARQVLYDYLWYRQGPPDAASNVSLERLKGLWQDTLRWCWELSAPEDAFRVASLMREWRQGGPLVWAVMATGYEAEWLPFLPKEGFYILPITLPVLPPTHSLSFYADLPYSALARWEQAPFRLKRLLRSGYRVGLSSQGAPDAETFWKHLRTLVAAGVSPDTLLLLLTQENANWLGLKEVGQVRPGAWANLLVFSDSFHKASARLLEVWVAGQRYEQEPIPLALLGGKYETPALNWQWLIPGGLPPYNARLVVGSETLSVSLSYDPVRQAYAGTLPAKLGKWPFSISSYAPITLAIQSATETKPYRLVRIGEPEPPSPDSLRFLFEDSLISRRFFPNHFYGYDTLPAVETVLIRQATVWTGDTVLPETDVLLARGLIEAVGPNLPAPPGALIVEAGGGALTAGIIDEHSHIAISGGVNEGTEAITAEVRIRDVIDPTDVNIFRHLAGGVTTVQLLHGSANPIGGQSACVSLRWGWPADSFLIPEAPPFNKFALGENVKQSNWGPAYTIRYPQTRMGVREIIRDAFLQARAYEQAWRTYDSLRLKRKPTLAPRRDLRLEALAEILAGKRYITCHSYVQSEILMLMRLAEELGFRIRTFTHVLEGYKVAPELKAHGAYASTFSDWWAYKYEVVEAIPHNAALLLSKGVKVCINSDDAEMARRLNQEAAKILRYGGAELGIDSMTAWKAVTVYPAEALGLSARRGYIRPGYVADVVLWDRPTPLSIYSRVRMTFVGGRRLYDREREVQRWQERQALKNRLVEKAWRAVQEETKGLPLLIKRDVLWHCEDLGHP